MYQTDDWPALPPLSALINRVHHMDALELLALLPDASIDLIATDPPYNGVKDEAWDNQWATDADFITWLDSILREYKRVLKPNGSLYLFASPRMAARVEIAVQNHFNVLNSLVWYKTTGNANWRADKEAVRSYLPNTERIVFASTYEVSRTGLDEVLNDQDLFPAIRAYFWNERQKIAEISYNEINQRMGLASNGGGMASNILNSYKVNWTFPTKETYELLARVTGVCQTPYETLRQEYEALRQEYEALRRPFNMSVFEQFTDVWNFATVPAYDGKHPAEKPLDMMRHIVRASSRPGAVVLDTFSGSGTTADAARREGRDFIACDFDARWAAYGARRVTLPFTVNMFEAMPELLAAVSE